jgi:aryl-alcohol dehydrogenase-like predicted oxidoreductase
VKRGEVLYRRALGSLDVSALCMGAMWFGTSVDERTAFGLLDRFVERGGNFLDTANCYCFWCDDSDGGESERLIGKWLAGHGARDDLVIATKVGAMPAAAGQWPANREGLSDSAIRNGVSRSLERLGTGYIDLLYGHIDDPSTSLDETASSFAALVRTGIARQIGMSNISAERFALACSAAESVNAHYSALQQRHTYLSPARNADFGYQRPLDAQMKAYALSHPQLTLLAYGVLIDGAYTNARKSLPSQYQHSGTFSTLKILADIAKEMQATLSQVIYAWMLSGTPPVIPIVGVTRMSQLDEAMDAVDLKLTATQLEKLEAARASI